MNFSFANFYKGWALFFEEESFIIFTWFLMTISVNWILGTFSLNTILLSFLAIIVLRKITAGGFCLNNIRLDGKYVIITGSNTGIGRETAKELARRGAKIILACRDVKKAEKVAADIKSTYNAEVRVEKLNLASFKSITTFGEIIHKNYSEIHCLINNAGIMLCPYMETEDGLEMQMGVNHFGHFLLTMILLPLLKKSNEARIINLSSLGHRTGRIPFEDFKYTKGYNNVQAYANSKIANILHARYLAKLLQGTNIQVFAVHPGAVQSELGRYLPFGLDFIYSNLISLIIKTTKEGAQTTVYCATEAVQHPYFYFSDCLPDKPASGAMHDERAEQLWKVSEQTVNMYYTLEKL